jgi:hypothetical protein
LTNGDCLCVGAAGGKTAFRALRLGQSIFELISERYLLLVHEGEKIKTSSRRPKMVPGIKKPLTAAAFF